MKLIASLTSPFSRKVRICFIEKEVNFQFVADDGWDVNSSISELNPLGKIPCLVLTNGVPIFDSSVIAEYIDGLKDSNPLLPIDKHDRAIVKTLEALADGMLDAAILARREKISRPTNEQSPQWIERQLNKVNLSLQKLSCEIGNSHYVYQNKFGMADIAIGCSLDWISFRLPEIQWQIKFPNLDNYFLRLARRSSYVLTNPRLSNKIS